MQVLQHVVDKVALLHVAKARVDRLGLDAIRDEPAQRAGGIGLDLRGGRQARHKRRVLALAIATAQDQIRNGFIAQMLRSFAGHALAPKTFACRGIKVGDDIALAHARGLGSASGLGMCPQLGPYGCRVALACLAIVRHTGERDRTARRLHRTAKAHAQQGSGLQRHAVAAQLGRQHGKRALFVRKRIAVQVDIGKQHGIVAARTKNRRIGKRREAHLCSWCAIDLVGLVIVGGTALVHLGSNAVENGHGRGLRHVEHASIVHKNVDDVTQQSRLCLATGLTVKTAKRAIGQRLGNGKHGLERRHGFVAPQRLEHVRDHARHVLKPVLVTRRFTRAPDLALHALQQALDARGGLAARETHILVEAARAGGVGTRKRAVNPVGKLRSGPPLSLGSGALRRRLSYARSGWRAP